MNRMQEWLVRAASELCVRIELEYVVPLFDGGTLKTQARFPDLGNELGTLVFSSRDSVDVAAKRAALAQGYGISTFAEPGSNEQFDRDSYAEMFAEWGWIGAEGEKPDWMD